MQKYCEIIVRHQIILSYFSANFRLKMTKNEDFTKFTNSLKKTKRWGLHQLHPSSAPLLHWQADYKTIVKTKSFLDLLLNTNMDLPPKC